MTEHAKKKEKMSALPTIADVFSARSQIYSQAKKTPLIKSETLSELISGEVWLKLETLQLTGSFKARGAANKILSLSKDERSRGLITISSGNHGRAVSAIAKALGIKATVCLYENVPQFKRSAIEYLGGTIRVSANYEAAEVEAERLRQSEGMTWVAPFDDPLVIAGQGTMGLEIVEENPHIDDVIIPLSGGGLFSGVGLAVRACLPTTRLIGVANDHGNGMLASLEAGKPAPIEEHPSLADCMAGTISPDNQYTFSLTQQLIDETMQIKEHEIVPAMAHGFFLERLVLEGGAALPIASILNDPEKFKGRKVALVLTGQNILMHTFCDAVMGHDVSREL